MVVMVEWEIALISCEPVSNPILDLTDRTVNLPAS